MPVSTLGKVLVRVYRRFFIAGPEGEDLSFQEHMAEGVPPPTTSVHDLDSTGGEAAAQRPRDPRQLVNGKPQH